MLPYVLFTGGGNVEGFEEPGEFWEDKWGIDKANPDDSGITWTFVGSDDFDSGWGGP